jgi:hypothetical protein
MIAFQNAILACMDILFVMSHCIVEANVQGQVLFLKMF